MENEEIVYEINYTKQFKKDYERLSVMDKVIKLYSPIIKKEYLNSSNK